MQSMGPDLTYLAWLALAGLAGLLVTCVLRVMSARYWNAIELHDRVHEARVLRRNFVETNRQEQKF